MRRPRKRGQHKEEEEGGTRLQSSLARVLAPFSAYASRKQELKVENRQ